MKKIILTIKIFLFSIYSLLAQKHDYTWLNGYESSSPDETNGYGLNILNFNDLNKASCDYKNAPIWIDRTSTTISDKDGNLLFYTNGVVVMNKKHQILKNGNGFNLAPFHDQYSKFGLPFIQGIIALPLPNNPDKYYLFYLKSDYSTSKSIYSFGLNYAVIDMKSDNGNGEMILKDVPLISDTLNQEGITAVKHGNGRDWWLLISNYDSNKYQRILLSPKGVQVLNPMFVKDTIKPALSQKFFTTDGKKYIRSGSKYIYEPITTDIFDFDRCTGILSNQKRFQYSTNNIFAVGASVSPNNRFLYTNSLNRIVQWDLQAPKIEESGDTVAYYDGFKDYDVRPTTFHTSRIAPDGKIYVTCGGTVRQFHVIHKPNRKGAACMMKQHDFQLKARNSATLPNHPNYRLGPIDGSPCDTLGIDNIPVALYRYDKDSANLYQVEFSDLSHYEPIKWEWDFGDGTPQSTAQEPVHIFPKKGEYQVCLTVSNSNGKHTYCRKIGIGMNATEVEEVENEIDVKIYPNPTSDYLHLSYDKEKLQHSQLIISDVQGKILLQNDLENDEIDVHDFPKGIYFLQILKENKVIFREKVVIIE